MPIFVNKVEITDDEVHSEMQHHPAKTMEDARQKAAEALVIRELLLHEAIDKKLLETREKDIIEVQGAAIDRLLKQEVSVPEADEDVCLRYYQQNQERFKDQKVGKAVPFESVKEHIRNYLYAQSFSTGISQYITVLASRSRIIGFEFEQLS
jgi:hypothetical protein